MTKGSTTFAAAFLLLLPALASTTTRASASTSTSIGDRVEISPPVLREEVSIADLDLETTDGWHAATVRLRRAATRVCAPQPDTISQMRCRTQSLLRARAALRRHVGLAYVSRAGGGHRRP